MGVVLALAVLVGTASASEAVLELEARPAHAEAGATESVTLRFQLPDATWRGAQVSLVANLGQLGELRPVEPTGEEDGPAVWTATWRPPPQRFPQIALLHASAELEGRVVTAPLVLPIYGRDTLKLRTKPHSKVTVTVAGRAFGGARADAKGEVEVTVFVPPGVETATVTSEDRVGNKTHKPLPLQPPPFSRAFAAVAHPSRAASWADAEPALVEIVAVTRTGALLPQSELSGLRAERGTVKNFKAVGPGRAQARYRAPRSVEDGRDLLRAEVRRDPQAAGRGEVVVRPGPPAQVEIALRPPVFVAGESDHLAVDVRVRDAEGNEVPVPDDVQIRAEVGEVVLAPNGERRLVIPPALSGRELTKLTVRVGAAEAVTDVPLRAGVPAQGAFALSKRMVRAGGGGAAGEIVLADAHGNPVTGASLEARVVTAGVESIAEVTERGEGRYAVALQAGARSEPGDAVIEVRPTKGEFALAQPLVVLPFQRDVGFSAGLWMSAHHNLGPLQAASPALELALRPTQLPLEALLQAGLFRYGSARVGHAGGDEGVFRRIGVDRQQVAVGARWSVPLGARLSLQASALGGVSRTRTTVSIEGLRETAPAVSEAPRWDPVVRGGAGLSLRFGPGRLMLEGRAGWAPSRGQVSGNFDGAGAAVGYLVEVR